MSCLPAHGWFIYLSFYFIFLFFLHTPLGHWWKCSSSWQLFPFPCTYLLVRLKQTLSLYKHCIHFFFFKEKHQHNQLVIFTWKSCTICTYIPWTNITRRVFSSPHLKLDISLWEKFPLFLHAAMRCTSQFLKATHNCRLASHVPQSYDQVSCQWGSRIFFTPTFSTSS